MILNIRVTDIDGNIKNKKKGDDVACQSKCPLEQDNTGKVHTVTVESANIIVDKEVA